MEISLVCTTSVVAFYYSYCYPAIGLTLNFWNAFAHENRASRLHFTALPINCQRLMRRLTADLPKDANIQLWVGAWRRGASWNHAKIIAADGKYLQTGGHNVWSDIYLKDDPIHDVSIEMEGSVAHDAHLFANSQWQFIEKKQASLLGQILENVPDFIPLASKNRVIVSEYPQGKASEFAPLYDRSLVPVYDSVTDAVAVISIGRQGVLIEDDRPADDAFIAMMDASKRIIRMSLQDLGPVTFPGVKIPLPSVGWPKPYFDALARAIWLRGVDVEIVLSNENAKSGYTNGWSCVDVASEIIKRITKQFPDAPDAELRQKVEDNLRICYIRHSKKMEWESGTSIGNHTKFFIVDDLVSYTGSQNLYEADLAEWGVIVDDTEQTAQMMEDYWTPLWEASYLESDCEVQDVMDGLKIDRDGAGAGDPNTAGGKRNAEAAAFAMTKAQFPDKAEFNDEDSIALDKSVVFDA